MKILCKLPTRGRPEKFFATLESLTSRASGDHDIQYLVSIDDDDNTMHTSKVLGKLEAMAGVDVVSAPRAGKIGSVNRDMAHALDGWDVVMQISDDFICLVDGWDNRIAEEMEAFPDGDGVVWFFDGFNRETDTLCIMGKKYYDRFGYIYNPDYRTLWADTEFTAVADLLDKLVFCDEVLFRHDHPDWLHSHGYDGQKQGYDELYMENDKSEDREWDENLFNTRKMKNFDLVL
jgi:hypothetical protein